MNINRNIKYTTKDYPMAKINPDKIFTPAGKNIKDITFDGLESGDIKPDDCRTSASSLMAQADIARASGNTHVAENFERAAELIDVDSDRLIEIYNSLRPYRSTEEELNDIVKELIEKYDAIKCAKFVKEAIYALKNSSKFRGDR